MNCKNVSTQWFLTILFGLPLAAAAVAAVNNFWRSSTIVIDDFKQSSTIAIDH